jgi:hypothetical protein
MPSCSAQGRPREARLTVSALGRFLVGVLVMAAVIGLGWLTGGLL